MANVPSRERVSRRAKITIALSAGSVVTSVLAVGLLEWSDAILVAAARGEIIQPEEVTRYQFLAAAIAITGGGLGLGKVIALLRWLHGAHLRAQQLGAAHRLARSARDAVVVWFIPIVNLYAPMQAVRGLAAASDPSDLPPATIERDQVSPGYRDPARVIDVAADECPAVPVTAWWIAWLASVVSAFAPYQIDRLGLVGLPAFRFNQLCQLGPVAAAVLTIIVVRNIDRRQVERARRWEARPPEDDDEVERVAAAPDVEPAEKRRRRARRPRSDG